MKGRDHSELGVNKKIALEWIFEKYGKNMLNELICEHVINLQVSKMGGGIFLTS
jgi:hypothetical protein